MIRPPFSKETSISIVLSVVIYFIISFLEKFSKGVAFFPLQIGDNVFIGEGSIVNAAVVSSYVYIGKNVIIGRRCVLKDCKCIFDYTWIHSVSFLSIVAFCHTVSYFLF